MNINKNWKYLEPENIESKIIRTASDREKRTPPPPQTPQTPSQPSQTPSRDRPSETPLHEEGGSPDSPPQIPHRKGND